MGERGSHSGKFPDTRWSLVITAHNEETPEGARALSELCELYWQPLYFYVRRRGYSPAEAEDLTQGFFHSLLKKRNFTIAEECRGKLRSFLLTSLKFFIADQRDKAQARKRGGQTPIISMDQISAEERYQIEPQHQLSPDVLYDKHWAHTVMSTITDQLRAEHEKADTLAYFEALHPYLTWNAGEPAYAEPAKALGISENAVRLRVMRMRKRFGDLLRASIAETVSSEDELISEMKYLFKAISS